MNPWRGDFPILKRTVNGKPLIYFDNANTAQKPQAVIDAVDHFYCQHNANVARAVHLLSEEATAMYERARERIAAWIGAAAPREIVMTSGTTMAINLVAQSYLRPRLRENDEVLITAMEHHANIVPWQLLCAATGARLVVAPIFDDGTLDVQALVSLISPHTKLVGVTHVSNVLGTINPIAEIASATKARGVPLLVDGSQALPHFKVDVRALGCDFYCFTGHKLFAPTGTGVLWARYETLDAMSPWIGGGEMIDAVSFERTIYAPPPRRFEAGTPNIAGFIGLAAAIDYLAAQDCYALHTHEQALLQRLLEGLKGLGGVRLIGSAKDRVPVVSFTLEDAHATDVAMLLDLEGVAVRSGQHCAHPLMQRFGVNATLRASMAFYNTIDEVDQLLAALALVRAKLA